MFTLLLMVQLIFFLKNKLTKLKDSYINFNPLTSWRGTNIIYYNTIFTPTTYPSFLFPIEPKMVNLPKTGHKFAIHLFFPIRNHLIRK